MKNKSFHPEFRCNGFAFDSESALLYFSSTVSKSVYTFLSDWFSSQDFVIVQTSGSTGSPKLIKIKKEFMINSALTTSAFFDLPEKTRALLCLSTDFIAGKMMLVRALVLGWHLDIVSPHTAPLKNNKKTYDFSAMVPMQLENSISKLHTIKKLIIGGGVVSELLRSKIQQVSTEIFATYGMTETITHIAVRKLNHFTNLFQSHHAIYTVLSSIDIYVDERNCLVIDAPLISENLVVTNDIVQLVSKTQFQWLGRFDRIINSGGIKLVPECIEKKMCAMINERFFVAGIPDDYYGERLVLVIEKDMDKATTSIQEVLILEQLSKLETLSRVELPKNIYFIANFIETSSQKVNRLQTISLIF